MNRVVAVSGEHAGESSSRKESDAGCVPRAPEIAEIGVTRSGEGHGLKINVSRLPTDVPVPREIDGVPVKVEVVGPIRKRAA